MRANAEAILSALGIPFAPELCGFARKQSLIEYKLDKLGITDWDGGKDSAFALLSSELPNFERAWASHPKQLVTAGVIQQLFSPTVEVPAPKIYSKSANALAALLSRTLWLSSSGDEFIKTLLQLVSDDSVVFPFIADSDTSDGALGNLVADVLAYFADPLNAQKALQMEHWTRLQVAVNGQVVGRAVDHLFVGHPQRRFASEMVLLLDGLRHLVSSSGWLIYTGTGSTGWADSAVPHMADLCRIAAEMRQKRGLGMIVTEPYQGRISSFSEQYRCVEADETIKIKCLLQDSGELLIDDTVCKPMKVGAVLEIRKSGADADAPIEVTVSGDSEEATETFTAAASVRFHHSLRRFTSRYQLTALSDSKGVSLDEMQKSSGLWVVNSKGLEAMPPFACPVVRDEEIVPYGQTESRFDLLITEPRQLDIESHYAFPASHSLEFEIVQESTELVMDTYFAVPVKAGDRISVSGQAAPANVLRMR